MDAPTLLMLGDSLIDYGEWHRRMRNYRIISSGVPGERTEELRRRLDHQVPGKSSGEIPSAIIIMSGTNDIVFGDLGFVEVLRDITLTLQQRCPGSQILLTSLLPYEFPGLIDAVHAANEQMKMICAETGCHYVDLCTEFEKSPERLFDYDGVHLSNLGYRLWASELDEFLANLLAKQGD